MYRIYIWQNPSNPTNQSPNVARFELNCIFNKKSPLFSSSSPTSLSLLRLSLSLSQSPSLSFTLSLSRCRRSLFLFSSVPSIIPSLCFFPSPSLQPPTIAGKRMIKSINWSMCLTQLTDYKFLACHCRLDYNLLDEHRDTHARFVSDDFGDVRVQKSTQFIMLKLPCNVIECWIRVQWVMPDEILIQLSLSLFLGYLVWCFNQNRRINVWMKGLGSDYLYLYTVAVGFRVPQTTWCFIVWNRVPLSLKAALKLTAAIAERISFVSPQTKGRTITPNPKLLVQ